MSGDTPDIVVLSRASKQARDYSLHISIYDRRRSSEGNAGHSGGCVGAYAGQFAQLCNSARKMTSVLIDDLPGGRMQCSGTTIVTKPAPCRQDMPLVRRR